MENNTPPLAGPVRGSDSNSQSPTAGQSSYSAPSNGTGMPAPAGSSKIGMIGLAVAMLAIGLVGGYYVGSSNGTPPVTPIPSDTTWRTYTNTEYGFEFQYPANWNMATNNFRDRLVFFNRPGEDTGLIIDLLQDITESQENNIQRVKIGANEWIRAAGRQETVVAYHIPFPQPMGSYAALIFVLTSNSTNSGTYITASEIEKILSTFHFTN